MNVPLIINFDPPAPDANPAKDGIVRLPKIYKGAPYSQLIRVRAKDSAVYRDFTEYDDIILAASVRQDQAPFLTLSKTANTIKTEDNGLRFHFPGSTTGNVAVPIVNPKALNELYFLHTIILIRGGVEVERFAQGYGYVVANIAKVPA